MISYYMKLKISNVTSVLTMRSIACTFFYLTALLFYCEYLIYYVVLLQCTWPNIENGMHYSMGATHSKPLKLAIIADTHLLGKRGHWFDKLRREWQMYRSFQTMITIHDPSVVFFLGDLFDEGLWSDDAEFNYYVQRFYSLFGTSESTKTYVVVGNHDIGFHYSIRPKLNQRFVDAFNAPPVNVLNIDGNIFVLVNSMALEGDGCFLCSTTQKRLHEMGHILKCSQNHSQANDCKEISTRYPENTKPVLMQHFPMYRPSDMSCEGPDVAPYEEKVIAFREKWECLSKESSDLLFDLIHPRLIFGGHTHHGCFVMHNSNVPEWSVPSFSWRNRNNPSFLLVHLTTSSHAITKCFLPQESTVMHLYILGMVLPGIWIVVAKIRKVTSGSHNKYR